MSLSDTKLRAIHNKEQPSNLELTDGDGLSVRITPKGIITFQYRYRWKSKPQRLSLGRYPALSLKDARVLTGEMRELYDKGIDPRTKLSSAERAADPTVEDCLNFWMDNYVIPQLRTNTVNMYTSTVYKHLRDAFKDRPVSSISTREFIEYFSKEEKINTRRARMLLIQTRSAMNWCIRRQYINSCSIMSISPKDIGKGSAIGTKVLTYQELAQIWIAIERSRAATSNKLLHQMLMLWGCRLSELRLSTGAEFNLIDKIWTVPSEHSKMGNVIRRPIFSQIEPMITKLIDIYGNVLFPGANLNKPITVAAANRYTSRIREGLDLGYWRAHDFRRTIVTRLSEEGVAPHVTERMLGHELGGIMAVYNKHDWLEDQRKGYELYADKIMWHVKNLS